MRLYVQLQPERLDPAIPLNYQYSLASALYGVLRDVEPEYARFLHEEGYVNDRGKHLKLFCFSRLTSDRKGIVQGEVLRWYGKPLLRFYLSSPLEETFIRNTLIGLLSGTRLVISSSLATTSFIISEVGDIPTPVFGTHVRGIALAPMTTSIQEPGRTSATYIPPSDPRFPEAIRQNLLGKHALLTGSRNDSLPFRIIPDEEYINARGERGISKLITIKQGHRDETRVRGFVFPFRLEGNAEMLRTAWDCGLGEKNSIGFGMWDLGTSDSKNAAAEHTHAIQPVIAGTEL